MLFRERQLMSSLKPGDWIEITYTSIYHMKPFITKYISDELINSKFIKSIKLWQPKVGEWVVVADDITLDLYAVFQFNNHSKDRQILPLAFLQTLKDQS